MSLLLAIMSKLNNDTILSIGPLLISIDYY